MTSCFMCGDGKWLTMGLRCPLCGSIGSWTPAGIGTFSPSSMPAAYALPTAAEKKEPEPVASPVEAWRIWQVHTGRLYGVGYGYRWNARTIDASCDPNAHTYVFPGAVEPPHASPSRHCGCGIWGLKDKDVLLDRLAHYRAHPQKCLWAYGRVHLWGRIFEHQHGYRAEHARPASITLLDGDDNTILQLARFYRCPVDTEPTPASVIAATKAEQREIYNRYSVALTGLSIGGLSVGLQTPKAAGVAMSWPPPVTRRVGSRPRATISAAAACVNLATLAANLAVGNPWWHKHPRRRRSQLLRPHRLAGPTPRDHHMNHRTPTCDAATSPTRREAISPSRRKD